jgi:voltage-gated potassium channel
MKFLHGPFRGKHRYRRIAFFIRKLYISLGMIAFTFLTGIGGFMFLENYSFLDAVFMTVITVSTVGYGEVHQLSETGKIFASLLIIINLGTFAYAISNLTSFILEGDLKRFLKDYNILNKVEKLENHVIVCGYGRYGKETALELAKQRIPFVVIENDEHKITELRDHKGFLFLEGDASQDEVLLEAGIKSANALIVTISHDAENVYVCLGAKQLNPHIRLISRAFDAKLSTKLKRAGADYVIMPEHIGGIHMATLVKNPGVIEFMSFLSNMGILFDEIPVSQLRPEYLNRSIRDLNIGQRTGAYIMGLRHGNGKCSINPPAETIIDANMSLILVGDSAHLSKFDAIMLQNYDEE